MIQLPDAIVIYPQKKNIPTYLLCWIPANEYPRVIDNLEKRGEYEKLFPRGIEIELSESGLEESGVKFENSPEQLKNTYLNLADQKMIPETGMVELSVLEQLIFEELLSPFEALSDPMAKGDLLFRITSPPPMTEGDDPNQVYRRVDVIKDDIEHDLGGE